MKREPLKEAVKPRILGSEEEERIERNRVIGLCALPILLAILLIVLWKEGWHFF